MLKINPDDPEWVKALKVRRNSIESQRTGRTMSGDPLSRLDGPWVVTAARTNRAIKDAGFHVFGSFATEREYEDFVGKVTDNPDWELGEIPVLNSPEVFGTGEERL